MLQPWIVEGQRPLFFIDDLDAGTVGSCAFQPRLDGVGNTVLRGLVQDVDGLPDGASSKGRLSPLESSAANDNTAIVLPQPGFPCNMVIFPYGM